MVPDIGGDRQIAPSGSFILRSGRISSLGPLSLLSASAHGTRCMCCLQSQVSHVVPHAYTIYTAHHNSPVFHA
eukprot:scaffold13771_cov105-Isochrysis_galbana.AAC.5